MLIFLVFAQIDESLLREICATHCDILIAWELKSANYYSKRKMFSSLSRITVIKKQENK